MKQSKTPSRPVVGVPRARSHVVGPIDRAHLAACRARAGVGEDVGLDALEQVRASGLALRRRGVGGGQQRRGLAALRALGADDPGAVRGEALRSSFARSLAALTLLGRR